MTYFRYEIFAYGQFEEEGIVYVDKERIKRVCQTAFKDKLLESSSGRSYIIPDWRFRSGLGSRKVFFLKF